MREGRQRQNHASSSRIERTSFFARRTPLRGRERLRRYETIRPSMALVMSCYYRGAAHAQTLDGLATDKYCQCPVSVQYTTPAGSFTICSFGLAARGGAKDLPSYIQMGVLPSIPRRPLVRRFEGRPRHTRTLLFSLTFSFPPRVQSSITFEYCCHPFGLQLGNSSTPPSHRHNKRRITAKYCPCPSGIIYPG